MECIQCELDARVREEKREREGECGEERSLLERDSAAELEPINISSTKIPTVPPLELRSFFPSSPASFPSSLSFYFLIFPQALQKDFLSLIAASQL